MAQSRQTGSLEPEATRNRASHSQRRFRETGRRIQRIADGTSGAGGTYIGRFDAGSPERGFIWATIDYFLRRDFANQPEEKIVAMADMIADKGGHAILSIPATGVLNEIAKQTDPTVISQILDIEKIELAKRFSDLSRCFFHARRPAVAA